MASYDLMKNLVRQDLEGYLEKIVKFFTNWYIPIKNENKNNKEIKMDIFTQLELINEWIKRFNIELDEREISEKRGGKTRLSYIKQGINYLKTFIGTAMILREKISDNYLQCQFQLLKGINGGNCSRERVEELKLIDNNIRDLMEDIIGCAKYHHNLILSVLDLYKMIEKDPEYVKLLDMFENKCLEIRLEKITL